MYIYLFFKPAVFVKFVLKMTKLLIPVESFPEHNVLCVMTQRFRHDVVAPPGSGNENRPQDVYLQSHARATVSDYFQA